VQRLATAIATPRPWHHIADPERARGYFEAVARRLLATARDPVAMIAREEREAERWAVTAASHDNLKEHRHG
jgi:hypothetical protein